MYPTKTATESKDMSKLRGSFEFKKPFDPPRPVLGNRPKIAVQAPSGDVSGNDTFFDGSLSGRSTSIGSGSEPYSELTKTLDEKFDDFSQNRNSGSNPFGSFQMTGDIDFGDVVEDNLALINADEQQIEKENQFMQEDAMINNPEK